MTTVHLGLGSNLGDRLALLKVAITALAELSEPVGAWDVSPIYATAPVGGPESQGAYLNCVLRIETERSARELLRAGSELEAQAGRVRTVADGPRPLDVDILYYGDATIDEPDLVVPHPRISTRSFVLAPLEDLDPGLVPVGWREALGGEGVIGRTVRRIGTLVR